MIGRLGTTTRSLRAAAVLQGASHQHSLKRIQSLIASNIIRHHRQPYLRRLSTLPASENLSLWGRFTARFTNRFWRRLATVVKYTRIPFLIASVYALGYQQGILESTRNPDALQRNILQTLVASLGVTEKEITIVQDGKIAFDSDKRHHQVAVVGRKCEVIVMLQLRCIAQ